jgi:prolyl 4-hydroxylase
MADATTLAEYFASERAPLARCGKVVRKRLAANSAVQPIDAGKAEMWVVPEFFDAVECGRLMTMIDSVAQPSKAYETDYSSGHRTSYSGHFDPFDPLVRALQDRIDVLLGLDRRFGETLQGQRYTAGQEFKPHNDWFPANSPSWAVEKDRGGQRAFTAMAYLNAVEEGGATEFANLGFGIPPRPGMLLVWNNADRDGVPNPWTTHAGKPVIRGSKYIVTKWYRCRRVF